MSKFVTGACVSFLMLACASVAAPDDHQLEAILQSAYVHEFWVIRGFYEGKELEFDTSGKLIKGGPAAPWTLAGIDVTSLTLRGKRIEIQGKRLAYVYLPDKREFTPAYRADADKVKIELQIQVPLDEASARQALDRVLLTDGPSLWECVPEYWREFLAHRDEKAQKAEPQAPSSAPPENRQVYNIDAGKGGVTAPKPTYTPDPKYTEAARKGHFQGRTKLHLIIDEAGNPTHIQIAKALGYGLDDKAVEAVSNWRFIPAERDGEPVAVQMYVDVAFRLN